MRPGTGFGCYCFSNDLQGFVFQNTGKDCFDDWIHRTNRIQVDFALYQCLCRAALLPTNESLPISPTPFQYANKSKRNSQSEDKQTKDCYNSYTGNYIDCIKNECFREPNGLKKQSITVRMKSCPDRCERCIIAKC